METFQERFCHAERCPLADFDRRVFRRCLHRHAVFVAPVIQLFNRRFFDGDRELIARVRAAETMSHVWDEIGEYFSSATYAGWLRRRANIRLSARRLIELAKQYLPSRGKPPSLPGAEPD